MLPTGSVHMVTFAPKRENMLAAEIRKPNHKAEQLGTTLFFGLRPSDFFRPSAFGFGLENDLIALNRGALNPLAFSASS